MSEHQIRFGDGAAHERMMGTWSRLAGDIFLDWLTPPPGLRWIDVGCRPSPTALAWSRAVSETAKVLGSTLRPKSKILLPIIG